MAQAVSSGEVAPTSVTRVVEGGEGGGAGGVDLSISGEEDKGVRMDEGAGVGSNYGNRWPRQETLALLKIRSEMDAVFRDSSLKGPLWEEVSRKLGEMGFHRSAKKCKEKFENVYKYHKRTKEGRAGKSEGKTYRFFDQLEAFQRNPSLPASAPPPTPPPKSQNPMPTTTTAAAAAASSVLPWNSTTTTTTAPPSINGTHHQVTVPLTTNPMNINNNNIVSQNHTTPTLDSVINPSHQHTTNLPISSFQTITTHLFPSSTSSSTASDEDFQGSRNKRKRKWKDFFERLTRDVIKKQEELQNKFLETVEKRERERMAREDAWRKQEMSRINREHEILIQERSNAAAKDAAVVAFLQKMSSSGEQQQQHISSSSLAVSVQPTVQAPPPQPPPPPPPPRPTPTASALVSSLDFQAKDNGGKAVGSGSTSSRWPKSEVEALIRLRSTLDTKYQENAPKGPLWEEISSGMRQLGYNRSAKRCKEKWENINKYFKKVKESNKKRAVDSKTCPYFDQLDALYKEKNKSTDHQQQHGSVVLSSSAYPVKPISTAEPLMVVHPPQHWPPPLLQQENHTKIDNVVQDNGRTELRNVRDGEGDDNDGDDDDDGDDDYEDTEEEDHGGGFEVVANKPTSSVGNGKVFN